MNETKSVRIRVESGKAGLLHATSEDMPELFVSGETKDELNAAIPLVMREIFRAHGHAVCVSPAGADDVWSVVPDAESVCS